MTMEKKGILIQLSDRNTQDKKNNYNKKKYIHNKTKYVYTI